MREFSAPLSRLATGFEETWEFKRTGNETHITRSFQMHAKSALTQPVLWLMSFLLSKAITLHLRQMRGLTQ